MNALALDGAELAEKSFDGNIKLSFYANHSHKRRNLDKYIETMNDALRLFESKAMLTGEGGEELAERDNLSVSRFQRY